MFTYETETLTVFHGESMSDVAEWLRSTPRRWDRIQHSETNDATTGWDLRTGLEGALRLAAEGWAEGAAKLHDRLMATPAPTNVHTELRYDVGGYFPDVARFTAGLPDHMVTRGKVKGNPPVVRMVINGWASAMVNANEYMNFGVAIASMVDQLESHGRRVELDIMFVGNLSGHTYAVGWNVKRAGEHLDLNALAFSLAHPAAWRRIGFAMMERMAQHLQASSYGYSHTEGLKRVVSLLDLEGAYILHGIQTAHGVCGSMAGALRFAEQSINAAAGEAVVSLKQ